MSAKTDQYIKRYTGNTNMVFSNNTVRTTISSTRNDTEQRGINSIHFITDGALTTVACTEGYIKLSTEIDSSSTFTAGSVIYVKDASKVVCTSHGAQMVYLNE